MIRVRSYEPRSFADPPGPVLVLPVMFGLFGHCADCGRTFVAQSDSDEFTAFCRRHESGEHGERAPISSPSRPGR